MFVKKNGKIVNIPVRCRTIALTRDSRSGNVTSGKVIVLGLDKASDFSRAYGRQCYYATPSKRPEGCYIDTCGVNDLYPVGVAKRIPKSYRVALAAYKADYESED
jgi:purine nucleoside permease